MAPNSTNTADMPETGLRGTPRQFLDTAIAVAARETPLIDLGNGQRRVIVPNGFDLHTADDPHALPPFIKSKVVVDDRASLVAYTNRFADSRSVLVADYDAGTIAAVLDYHGCNAEGELQPAPGRHLATLKLRDSEEFKRWNAIQGDRLPQAEFAAFLEENSEDICDPDPAVMIEISRDLEATQGVTFKSSTRLENGDRAFVYETETRTKGELRVPREFHLQIPLYQGEAPARLRCAFRWQVSGGGLVLGFEWRRVEYLRQAFFAQIATQASEETGVPVFYGRLA